jgi:hypothetical protein
MAKSSLISKFEQLIRALILWSRKGREKLRLKLARANVARKAILAIF